MHEERGVGVRKAWISHFDPNGEKNDDGGAKFYVYHSELI